MCAVANDGGVAGGGAEARGDAAHVPRVQGGAAHHRRRVDGDGEHARAAARQERLAGEPPRLQPAPLAALARRPAPRHARAARYTTHRIALHKSHYRRSNHIPLLL